MRVLIKDSLNYQDKVVELCGWVQGIRSHSKIIFFDLRDMSGIVQVVFTPKTKKEVYQLAKEVRSEWVVKIKGKVIKRPDSMVNENIETGGIEIQAEDIEVFSKAKTLPFSVDTLGDEVGEKTRLKYRYLDLRRERMKRNLRVRQQVIHFMRNFLINKGFLEVETPILTKSTPEGARDFVVPSRIKPGKFYALPQSPQQYKQLLMVAGIEKYFQIARCLRDEDPRADRHAEFTQLDIEMSFASQDEILNLIEELYIKIVEEIFPEKKITQIPFPRLTYKEAQKLYKTDKPDLRKNPNDPDELAFCFIVDFPLFEWKEEEDRWDAMHHPFTLPQNGNLEEIKKDPENMTAYQYDFALNGVEIGGGSLRIFDPDMLRGILEIMKNKREDIEDKFHHLLEAFEYGVPPHGGIAPGIDRFLIIALNEPNIREVIAFPKTGDNKDLMMDSPSKISKEQLKELHIKTIDEQ